MKFFRFFLSLCISVALAYVLNRPLGPVPPLGKFLNPASGFWQQAGDPRALPPENLILPGLQEPVTVVYDEHLIPHIYASNNHDLYYAQGYVTALHRLWQMEFQTHAAAGRLSEIVGEATLDMDRTARRKGMVFAAENALKTMEQDPRVRESVAAYTAGINAYINQLSYADYPIEYKLLDYAPEPWTPLKSALLLKYMANTLNFGNRDLQNTNALRIFGRELFDILYPDLENPEDPIVNNPGGWDFEPVPRQVQDAGAVSELIQRRLAPAANPFNGSNNWAIGPDKSASGNPILSSDPHLGLNLPSIWYMIHLNSPDVNVMGVSLPGSPNVIIGYNDSIAWGVTNAQRDLVDWYKIEFNKDKSAYLLDGEWVKTEVKVEEIRVRNGNTYYDTVYYTHFGPVMYDDSYHPDNQRKYYALRWIAHDPSAEALAFYLLNRARNYDDYMAALDHYASPAQNFAFAAANGDIAMRIQGRYPNKAFEEGKFMLDGTTTRHDWTFIPNEHNIRQKNPERGFVSSANQYPADSTYPYYITASSYENYRNRRINRVLRAPGRFSPQDMMRLQNDNYNLKAAESLNTFLHALDSIRMNAREAEAFKILALWDYYNHPDSRAASYYERWWDILYPMLWDEMFESNVPLARPGTYTTIKLLRERPDFPLFDIKATPEKEDARAVLIKAFRQMAAEMAGLAESDSSAVAWGRYKDTRIAHLVPALKPFGRYHILTGGNHGIVNATSETHGPSWRYVVELDPAAPRAWGIYPGGQSGNPGSYYYDNMIELWADGEYLPLQLAPRPDKIKDPLLVQTLNPAEQ